MRRLLLIGFLLIAWLQAASAWEFYSIEDYALQAVNAFRSAPLSYEAWLDVKDEDVRKAWGAYYSLLEDGLPLLRLDERLNQAAKAKIADMIQKSYFSVVSPDGVGPDELVEQYGVDSLISGISIAYIAFERLIPAKEAFDYMFRLMERKSLLMQSGTCSSLLYPAYTDFGVAFASIGLDTENGRMNVYILCFLFASEYGGWNGDVFVVGRADLSCGFAFRDYKAMIYNPLIFPDGVYYVSLPAGMDFLVVNSNNILLPMGYPTRVDLLAGDESCKIRIERPSLSAEDSP